MPPVSRPVALVTAGAAGFLVLGPEPPELTSSSQNFALYFQLFTPDAAVIASNGIGQRRGRHENLKEQVDHPDRAGSSSWRTGRVQLYAQERAAVFHREGGDGRYPQRRGS